MNQAYDELTGCISTKIVAVIRQKKGILLRVRLCCGEWGAYVYPLSDIDPLGLKTYMRMVPLHSMGGSGTRSGPDVWGNPFYHQYLCVYDGKGGYVCGGQDRSGGTFFPGSPGKATNDTWPTGENGACKQVDDKECVDECVKSRVSSKKRPWYQIPFGIDCQDWSDEVLNSCQKSCSSNNHPVGMV